MKKSAILLAIASMFINSTAHAEVRKEYYDNGQVKEEANLKDGKLEGIGKYYYESGQLWEEGNFKDGKLEGITKTYYENGQLQAELNYSDGKLKA